MIILIVAKVQWPLQTAIPEHVTQKKSLQPNQIKEEIMLFFFDNAILLGLVWLLVLTFPVFLYREASIVRSTRKTVIIAIFSIPTMVVGAVIMALLFLYQENRMHDAGKQ